jgi:hypothetical protein
VLSVALGDETSTERETEARDQVENLRSGNARFFLSREAFSAQSDRYDHSIPTPGPFFDRNGRDNSVWEHIP